AVVDGDLRAGDAELRRGLARELVQIQMYPGSRQEWQYVKFMTAVKKVKSQLDLAVPSTPANSFITDICVRFLFGRGDWLPSAAWVSLLGSLEIPAPSARTALHRMTKGGYLEHRRPGYAMSTAWKDYIARDEPLTGTDDTWTVLTFSFPEENRAER